MAILVSLALVVTLASVALIRAYAELDEDLLQEWAQAHALDVTSGNRPMVRWYLRTARLLRTWGALAGLFLPALAAAAFGSFEKVPPVWVFVGYLLGALYAELSLFRPLPDGRRAASLVPRALAAYLPRRLLVTQRCLAAMIAVASLALAFVPFEPDYTLPVDLRLVLLGVVGGPALALGLEQLQGWLVRRPGAPSTERAARA